MRRRQVLAAAGASALTFGAINGGAVAQDLADWPRPYFDPEGAAPFLRLAVLGDLDPGALKISRSAHRTAGAPRGIDVTFADGGATNVHQWLSSAPSLGAAPELRAAALAAPAAFLIEGDPESFETLNYLRDAIGMVQAMLEQGGAACVDMNALTLRGPEAWRTEIFEKSGEDAFGFVQIYETEGSGGGLLLTRGMRSFGRPDLRLDGVQPEWRDGAVDVINRFIGLHIGGGVIPEGAGVKVVGFPEGYVCRHRGPEADPAIAGPHVSIEPA